MKAAPGDVSPSGIGFDTESAGVRGGVGRGWVKVGWFSFGFVFSFPQRVFGGVLAAQICTFKILEGTRWEMDLLVFPFPGFR